MSAMHLLLLVLRWTALAAAVLCALRSPDRIIEVLNSAKDALKRAYDTGDTEQITSAQEKLMEAKLKLRDMQNFKPSLQDEEEGVQHATGSDAPRRC